MRPLRQVCSYLKPGQSGTSVQGHNVLCNPHFTYTAKDTEQARVDTLTHTHGHLHVHSQTKSGHESSYARSIGRLTRAVNDFMAEWFLLTFAQCKARAQKTANILKLFSSVLVKALPLSLFTICTTPITVPLLTMGMHRMFRVV